jgi:3-oxoacyl-(acyl-carrier-protein) synthase
MKVACKIISAAKVYAPEKIEDLDEKRIVPKMMLRRRLTRNAKIMLYLADKCGFEGTKVVYGSAFGELQATAGITDAIAENEQISPILFQNSVYNSAPSYFSLLHGDKDEIITISSGDKTSSEALKTAALQALISGEQVLCVVTECLDIARANELNKCNAYLEAGAAVVIEVVQDEQDVSELQKSNQGEILDSLRHLFWLVNNKEGKSIFIEL